MARTVVPRGVSRPHGISARRRRAAYALLIPGGTWLVVFFIGSVLVMGYMSLKSGGLLSGGFRFTWSFGNYADALAGRQMFFLRSVVYAGATTLGTVLLAYPAAYWIAFYGGRFKSALLFMFLLPYFVSFVIRTVQWKFILADNGIVLGTLKDLGLLPEHFRVLSTWVAVIGGLIYNYLPFAALPLYVAVERIDRAVVEGAYDLYATPLEAFAKVIFPLSMPGVFAATLLTFVPATGDYVEAEVLGGPTTRMIGNIIQTEYLYRGRYPVAAALSMVLMVGMVVLTSVYAKLIGTEDETVAKAVGA
jgi:spermidine/putrescine transport system permease protein